MSTPLRIAALAVVFAAPLFAQRTQGDRSDAPAANARRPLTESEYGRIETLGTSALSPDGKWVAYDFRRTSGGGELRYRMLGSESEKTVRNGSGAVFSANNQWLLYTIGTDSAAAGGRGGRGAAGRGGNAGAGTGAANRNSVGIVDLRMGTTSALQDVQSFVVSKDGAHVALRRYPAAGRRGADLVVRDLEQGADVTFGNIAEFAWSDNAPLLAMTVDVEGKTGNGVQVFDAANGAIRSLDAGDMSYVNLQWRSHGQDLVAFRARPDSAFVDTSYTVIAWRGLGTTHVAKQLYDFGADNSFAKSMRVASYRRPQWSEDGGILFFGIAPREPKTPAAPRGGPQPARVQVWHWKDLRQFHQQQVQAAQDRQRTQLVAWHLAPNKLVRLADDSIEDVQLSRKGTAAVAVDEGPYFKELISGRQYRDLYRVDLTTGKRDNIVSKVISPATMSPSGRYTLYTQGGHWWSYDATTGGKHNLTASIKSAFVDMEDDHPVPERRGYGVAGWSAGEKSVVLYDRFADRWLVRSVRYGAARFTAISRRTSREISATWSTTMVRHGSTIALVEVNPDDGSHCRLTEKMIISMMPSQKVGIASPKYESAVTR